MKILFHRNFDKGYKKLPASSKKAFKMRLRLFTNNPFHPLLNNHSLAGRWQEFRSINVTGNLRALYRAVDESVAEFVAIDTHSNLYE